MIGDEERDEARDEHGGHVLQLREPHELEHEHARSERREEQGGKRRSHAGRGDVAVDFVGVVVVLAAQDVVQAERFGNRRPEARANLQRPGLLAHRAAG